MHVAATRRHECHRRVIVLFALAVAIALATVAPAAMAQSTLPFGVFRNNAAAPDGAKMQYIGAQWTNRLVRPLDPAWWNDADNTITLQCANSMFEMLTFSTAPDSTLDANFPPDLAAWSDSVSRVVERYDGDGYLDMPNLTCPNHYWHVEAEDTFWKGTIDEYLTYLAVTRAAILAADPTAKVITLGLSSAQTWNAAYYTGFVSLYPPTQGIPYDQLQGWLISTQRMITEGSYDILDIHSYETHNVVAGKLAWLRSILPPGREIWALEGGAPFYTRRQGYTDTLNSQGTVEWYAECLANGMGRVADGYLGPSPGNFDYTEQFINVSLTRWNPYPLVIQTKPAYEAYAQLTDKLEGFTSAADLSNRSGADETLNLYDMRFQTPRGVVDVVWTPTGTRTLAIPVVGTSAKVTHLIERAGQTKAQAVVNYLPLSGGVVTLSVNSDPVFVEGSTQAAGLPGPGDTSGMATLAMRLTHRAHGVDLRCEGASGAVSVTVSDVRGAHLHALRVTLLGDGVAEATWDYAGGHGQTVAPGVYFLAATDARGRRGVVRVLTLQ